MQYSADGATLTAACKNNSETNSSANVTASLTISAPTNLTCGDSGEEATLSDTSEWENLGLTLPTVYYEGISGTTYEESEIAPSDAGTYKASITMGEGDNPVTASVEYTLYAEHTHNDITFQPWTETTSLPTAAGNYCLTTDVTLSSTWNVNSTVSLCLNGYTIALETGKTGSVIKINSESTLNLYDCTTGDQGKISGGSTSTEGGGVYVSGAFNMYGGTISNNTTSGDGGGVYVNGTFNMYGGIISENHTSNNGDGGGVYVSSSAIFTMQDGKISGNTAPFYGGGVHVEGSFNMYGGAISDNEANYGGGVGVLRNTGTFKMSGGKISGNKATSKGGGVSLYNCGSLIMSDGEISGNKAKEFGGGVEAGFGGKFELLDGLLSNNTASLGGGVYAWHSSKFTMSGGTIYQTCNTTVISNSESTVSCTDGKIYVGGGTLGIDIDETSGTSVYYPLTLTNATAAGTSDSSAVSDYESQRWGKAGSSITLTVTPEPTNGQYAEWAVTPNNLEVENADATAKTASFTMPSAAVTAAATISNDALLSISIGETRPAKATYTYGESFDPAGLKVTAAYASGNTADVTADIQFGALTAGQSEIELSYTENGVTKICTVSGITVAQAAPTYSAPTGLAATYGDTLASVTLTNQSANTPGTWTWMDDTQSVGDVGEHIFKAKFTPDDTTNYSTVENIDVTVTVSAKPVTKYTVTLAASPEAGGTVTGGGTYPEGTSVTVTATPASGYLFVEWRDADGTTLSTEAEYTFTAKANVALTAVFEAEKSEVTATASPAAGGTAVVSDSGDGKVTVKAESSGEYVFVRWTNENGETLSKKASDTIDINGSTTLIAEFAIPSETSDTAKIEVNELTSVPAELQDKYNTVDEIKDVLYKSVVSDAKYTSENSVVQDVELLVSFDGGNTWEKATEENFPSDGLTVTLAYPTGTNKDDYDFKVSHMYTITSTRLSTVKGETEAVDVTETNSGLKMTLHGLSPVLIAWTERTPTPETPEEPDEPADDTTDKSGSGSSGAAIAVVGAAAVVGTVIVAGNVIQKVAPTVKTLVDIHKADSYYEAVKLVYESHMMDAASGYLFMPKSSMKRNDLAVALYVLDGSPAIDGDCGYTDVNRNLLTGSYYSAVTWAERTGVVAGYADNTFKPSDAVTQERLALALYTYAQAKGYDTSALADLTAVPGMNEITPDYMPAMQWAVANGFITANADGRLDPQGTITRADTAEVLRAFVERYDAEFFAE